ncbi:Heat shock 70 kDa protein BIP2 [Linum perenne]
MAASVPFGAGSAAVAAPADDAMSRLIATTGKTNTSIGKKENTKTHTELVTLLSMAGHEMKGGHEVVIGIDLGTTYSCVAVARAEGIDIIANDQGNRTTPSYVAFSGADQDYERLIGEAAKNQATINPGRTFFDVKRLMGKKFDDPEVCNDMKYLPYRVVNEKGNPYVQVNDGGDKVKPFSPEEISAMVLGKMKETAESYLGKAVNAVVVTVPAYFNDAQRQATKDAGTIAGLNVVRIINEPTAGALAYGWKCNWNDKRKILVYDLGGGTFDVSILETEGDVFHVLATGGDTHLGGGDFDQRVMKYFIELIKRKYRKDVSLDIKALGKLRKECEKAKRALSVLVGGSTRIPKVKEMLRDMFGGKEPCKGVNPDEAVAYGAAVLGAKLSGALNSILYDVTLCDVTPLSLGHGVLGDLMSVVVPRNTPIPTEMSQNVTTVADQQTSTSITVSLCLVIQSYIVGHAKMEVTFEIDEDGILTATAREKDASATTESIRITSYKGNLTKAEIERMISKAEKMSKKDKIAKARVEARNELELFIYDVKKAVANGYVKNRLSWNEKTKIERELEEASVWLDENRPSTKEDYERRLRVIRDACNPIKLRCYG